MPAASELLGYSEEEFQSKALRDLFVDPEVADVVVSSKVPTSSDIVMRRKDGTPVTTMFGGGRIDDSNVVISCRDAAPRRRQEELQLLSEVFHEVAAQTKPALALVFAWLHELQEELCGKKTTGEEQAELLDRIVRQLSKVQLTYDRLAHYRREQRARLENVIVMDLEDLLKDVLSDFPKSEIAQVLLDWHVSDAFVKGEPSQIAFAFENTISYLLRFLPQNGTISVSAEPRNLGDRRAVAICIEAPAPREFPAGDKKDDVHLSRVKHDISFGIEEVARVLRENGGVFSRSVAQGKQRFEFLLPVAGEVISHAKSAHSAPQ